MSDEPRNNHTTEAQRAYERLREKELAERQALGAILNTFTRCGAPVDARDLYRWQERGDSRLTIIRRLRSRAQGRGGELAGVVAILADRYSASLTGK